MKIELLGTGGYFANERRQTACILLPEWGIVFDAGSALFRLSKRCPARELHLFLTHPHLDHICGLPFLLMPMLFQQTDQITVHGTAETLEAVSQHIFAEAVFPVAMPFHREKIAPTGSWLLENVQGSLTVRWQSLPSHPGGSMAYRVDLERSEHACSMAYVTDTCVDGTYSDFIHGVDLLIHECYFGDGREELARRTGHSCASQVADLARETGAGRLVIVHVDPTSELEDPIGIPAMQRIFARTELGYDGLQLELP